MANKIVVDPEEVRFSQDSIARKFSPNYLDSKLIGVVLDEIIDGKRSYTDVSAHMTVSLHHKYPNLKFAVNNRGLWVLKQLKIQQPQFIDKVEVILDKTYLKREKFRRFTTKDEGKTIEIRGYPGGKHKKDANFWRQQTFSYSGPANYGPSKFGVASFAAPAFAYSMNIKENILGENYDSDEDYVLHEELL